MSAEKVLLPAFPGNGTTKISRWYVKLGDRVEAGQLLAEIETDKATMDFESYTSGRVLYLGAEPGKEIREGYLLIIIGDKGTDVSGLIQESLEAYVQSDLAAPTMAGSIAEIKLFAGKMVPRNWRVCDGSTMKKEEAEELYKAISDSFGVNEHDTFYLPIIESPTAGVNYIICVK